MTPVQYSGNAGLYSAEYGGEYQEGNEYDLNQDQIDEIMRNGGTVEYLD